MPMTVALERGFLILSNVYLNPRALHRICSYAPQNRRRQLEGAIFLSRLFRLRFLIYAAFKYKFMLLRQRLVKL